MFVKVTFTNRFNSFARRLQIIMFLHTLLFEAYHEMPLDQHHLLQ